MRMKLRLSRWMASLLAAGCLLQAGGCSLSDESLAALANEVFVRQAANLLSDTVFFVLDNALVRWTS
jgi:hypothetical protein